MRFGSVVRLSVLFASASYADPACPGKSRRWEKELRLSPRDAKEACDTDPNNFRFIWTFQPGKASVGEINCQDFDFVLADAGPWKCRELAVKNGLEVDEFLSLNPTLKGSCWKLRPWHIYCTRGCKYRRLFSVVLWFCVV